MNKLLILFIGLMLSYSSLSQAQKIYVRTDGDTFQYTENTLKKIDISAERKESNISLMRKELTPNEFASVFQSFKVAGCRNVKISESSVNFTPYKSYEHFVRYYEAYDFNNGLVAVIDKRTSKTKTIAVYDYERSQVCSTGVAASAAFFLRQLNTMFFAECVEQTCSIFQLSGLNVNTPIERIMDIQGEVVDMGYNQNLKSLIVLVRNFKEEDGVSGRLLSKIGHGREKYDLYSYEYKIQSKKEARSIVGKNIVNPSFWIEQSWFE